MERHALAVIDTVLELGRLGLVSSASASVRVWPAPPQFKLYLFNRATAFFGYYPVVEHEVPLNGATTAIWDLMGKDATLFEFSSTNDPDSTGSQFVAQSQLWFDSIWTSVAKDYDA